jgi:hypothetical protein
MTATPKDEISNWVQAITRLHEATVRDDDTRAASDAAASVWSGGGFLDASAEVLQMFTQAIEVGYATALQHLREGYLDDEVRTWRPEVSQG